MIACLGTLVAIVGTRLTDAVEAVGWWWLGEEHAHVPGDTRRAGVQVVAGAVLFVCLVWALVAIAVRS